MRRLLAFAIGLALAIVLGWSLGFVRPYGPIGGGRLRGAVSPPPADWSFVDRIPEIEIETRWGPLPWTVTTWVLSHDRKLYAPSRNCLAKRWVKNVLAQPDVRVRIADSVYELRAVRDEDPAVGRALLDEMLRKYLGIEAVDPRPVEGQGPEETARAYGCAFRLEPRS